MRKFPSWFKFLAVTLAFEVIISSSDAYRLTGLLMPRVWWFLIGKNFLTLAFMPLLASQSLQSDGLRVTDLGLSLQHWKRDLAWGSLIGGLLAVLLIALKATVGSAAASAVANAGLIKALGDMEDTPATWGALVLMMGLLAPLIEEFQFRAYAMESLMKSWGDGPRRRWLYAAASAMAFTFVHSAGHPDYYPFFFLAGLALAGLYLRTRSMAACTVAHGAANLFQLLVGYYWAK